jgi:ribonuclease HI
MVYTDGSFIPNKGAASSFLITTNNEDIIGYSFPIPLSSSFEAEMSAIDCALEKARKYMCRANTKRIILITDSESAIKAIMRPSQAAIAPTIRSLLCLEEILQYDQEITVMISWCPSHMGIRGNERCDEMATAKAAEGHVFQYNSISVFQ